MALQWVDVEKARLFIPKELEIISLWPGKTLGGIYVSSYGLGSVMEYNELIVTSAIVSYAGKKGSWISHIYVDNPNSVAGGREIWGLPKELAEFNWEEGQTSCVLVTQGNRRLCSFSYSQPIWAWRMPISSQTLSASSANFLSFKSECEGRFGFTSSQLQIPVDSPFYSLNLSQPWLTISWEELNLVVSQPSVIGPRNSASSYY